MTKCRIAAVQRYTDPKTENNLTQVAETLAQLAGPAAGEAKPDIVVLPEMFSCPYEASNFPAYAEEEGGATWQRLSAMAADAGVYFVAGSVPERDAGGHIFNTSYVFDREGRQIAKHRKVHLFDIDVRGGQYFKESDTLTPGDAFTTFPTEFGTMGLCICYDIRFPETFRIMADRGARLVFVPAAFNMTTGPAHWELTFRARALDNQMFLLGCAPARDEEGSYVSFATSILTDPWGRVVEKLGAEPGILQAEVDLNDADDIREQLPLLKHRRRDLYQLVEKG